MKNKALSPTGRTVLTETKEAYFDCWNDKMPFEETMKRRQLNFRASQPVSRDEAVLIMGEAIGKRGYNNFQPKLLALLPADAKVILAREGSPCIYVQGQVEKNPKMLNDEWHFENNETRLWWD